MVRKKKSDVVVPKTMMTRSTRAKADAASTSHKPEDTSLKDKTVADHLNDDTRMSVASDNDSNSASCKKFGKYRSLGDETSDIEEQEIAAKSTVPESVVDSESSNFTNFNEYSYSNGTESSSDCITEINTDNVDPNHVILGTELVNNNCDGIDKQTKLQNGSFSHELFENCEIYHDENDDSELITVFEIVDDQNFEFGEIPLPDESPPEMSPQQINGVIHEDEETALISKIEEIDLSSVPFPPSENGVPQPAAEEPKSVRRSTRIKSISVLKQRSKGHGLVKTPHKKVLQAQLKDDSSSDSSKYADNADGFAQPLDADAKPVKVKSRWRRSSEMEMHCDSPITPPMSSPTLSGKSSSIPESAGERFTTKIGEITVTFTEDSAMHMDKDVEEKLRNFQTLAENEYLCEKTISRDARQMTCDCFLTKEEIARGELGCGEDCLNRLLMIECNSKCPVGNRCTNRRFQKNEYIALDVVRTEKKGFGVQAIAHIPPGEFLLEYVGEVLNFEQFYNRATDYSADNYRHHYFMALKSDTIIDATQKGNISRFINHSCDPNAETQKWTVNGELRVGFFTKYDIRPGEEITFDYQFQRYGKEAQKCFCGSRNCRGWIGAEPNSDDEESELEDEDEEDSEKASTISQQSQSDSKDKIELVSKPDLEKRRPVDRDIKATKEGKPRRKPRPRPPRKEDLFPDTDDAEKEIALLSRTGVCGQAHTLLLSRAALRAPTRSARAALLCLLRAAPLPCRRLFLDYRGLRLLAPWHHEPDMQFRLELLQTLEKLPIPNKTMLKDCRLISAIERWIQEYSITSENSTPTGSPLLVDDATGLAFGNKSSKSKSENCLDAALEEIRKNMAKDISDEKAKMKTKLVELSQQLLDRWSTLKEVFKIPKKERILQMKEHEREANKSGDQQNLPSRKSKPIFRSPASPSPVQSSPADSQSGRHTPRSSSDRRSSRPSDSRWSSRDSYRRESDHRRESDRDRKDHDHRREPEHRRDSDPRRESVLSKEERRRAFAVEAEKAERRRIIQPVHQSPAVIPPESPRPPMISTAQPPPHMWPTPYWPQTPHEAFSMNGFPMPMPPMEWGPLGPMGPMMGPPLHPGFPPVPDFSGFGFCPPFGMPPGFGAGSGPLPAPPLLEAAPPPALAPPPLAPPAVPPAAPPPPPPPPLPAGWRSACDARGRLYFYQVRLRQPQWALPRFPDPGFAQAEESSEEEEESDTASPVVRKPQTHVVEGVDGIYEVIDDKESLSSNGLLSKAQHKHKQRKRRSGLITELLISPRTEEDKLANKMEVKRYRETKEKLKKRKEKLQLQSKPPSLSPETKMYLKSLAQRRKQLRELKKRQRRLKDSCEAMEEETEDLTEESPKEASPVASEAVSPADAEAPRRLKEAFRSAMARIMVQHLNPYRRHDCALGKITNTRDFKHLARKLTHFVMLKELKHCRSIEELQCNDSVKQKAKEFVRKYMAKYGPVYQRPEDEMD